MAAVNVTSVRVLDNPAPFTNPLQFEIQYECLYDLKHDLEWKLIYVGSAESEKYDQTLDSVLVGPVVPGQYRFVFQADPPDAAKLPPGDIVGVTVLLLTCSYQGNEFLRVGYYVNNEYWDEALRETPPDRVLVDRLSRSILADKPRVTRFPIEFDPVDDAGAAAAAAAAAAAGAGVGATETSGFGPPVGLAAPAAAPFGAPPPAAFGAPPPPAFGAPPPPAFGAPPPLPAFGVPAFGAPVEAAGGFGADMEQ